MSTIGIKLQVLLLTSHLQQLDGEDQRLQIGLKLIQVLVPQRVVGMDLSNATAVPLALQGVLTSTDVSQGLGHERIKCCVLKNTLQMVNAQKEQRTEHDCRSIPTCQLTNLIVTGKFCHFALFHGDDHSLPHS